MKIFCLSICITILSINLNAQSAILEKKVQISITGCTIDGSLIATNTTQPLAIIIAGSGPTDRNGNSKMGVNANSYKMIAEALNREKIASFRYDKRGVGKSSMLFLDEKKLRFDTYVQDVISIYDYLKDSLSFSNIFFVGHSEGSLIGMIAAQKRNISGFISLSGAGRNIDVVLHEQLKTQPLLVRLKVDSLFETLKKGQLLDSIPPYLNSLFRPSIQPYMISWLKHNPTDEIKKVTAPILILQGSCDKQVTVEDAQNLHIAKANSELHIIANMTHTLKNTDDQCSDTFSKTYTDANLPINESLIQYMVAFIKKDK